MTETTRKESHHTPDVLRGRLFFPDWFTAWEPLKTLLDTTEIRVEEYRENGTFVVRAELPGIDPDNDVEITVADGVLRIKAERRAEHETRDEETYRSELHYGAFTRTLPLPRGAQESEVVATYADGVLTVRIPVVAEEPAAKKVPITRG